VLRRFEPVDGREAVGVRSSQAPLMVLSNIVTEA
jgi:hypothetical protein